MGGNTVEPKVRRLKMQRDFQHCISEFTLGGVQEEAERQSRSAHDEAVMLCNELPETHRLRMAVRAGPQPFKSASRSIADDCWLTCIACVTAVALVSGGLYLIKPLHDGVVLSAAPTFSFLPIWALEQVATPFQEIWDDVVTSALRVRDTASFEIRCKLDELSGRTSPDTNREDCTGSQVFPDTSSFF